MSESEARRVRLTLAYDGTDFHGWQSQARERTVQDTLERALAKVAGDRPVRTRAAGRTDAGVHARAQVADASLACPYGDADLRHRLNRLLPDDVRVVDVETVPEDFHSRFGVRTKTYVYRIDVGPVENPFRRRSVWHLREPPDLAPMKDAARRLLGAHDFTSFSAPSCTKEDRVRTVAEASWRFADDRWTFRTTADGFLTYMVRNMVGALVRIGRGELPPTAVDAWIAERRPGAAGPTAPACGLTLERVVYDPPRTEDR